MRPSGATSTRATAPIPTSSPCTSSGRSRGARAVPGSDVDLLVVLEHDPRPPRDRIPDHLPGGFPVGVDVIVWTRAEMEERLARHDRLARTILAEGETLFDRGSADGPRAD